MINKETLRKWWDVFVGPDNFTEIRMLGRFSYSGYFNTYDALVKAIEPYSDMEDEQMYFVLNKIDDACYGRQQTEKIVKTPKITTNDNDIVRRRWVLCDFDPVRKSGTNSSNEELEYAHGAAQKVFKFLREQGFSEPVISMSGNGYHLVYRIDEDVSDETEEVIKGFYKYLALNYSDDKVDFDQKNFNEARICKLYGTTAKKGANLQDRPWRESRIIYVPSNIQTTPLSKFRSLADLVPKEEPKQQTAVRRNNFGSVAFDLDAWLTQHGIVYRTRQSGNSTLYELEYCPWIDTHSDRKKWDSALFKDADGKITFNCTHSHCQGKTWQDVRLFYEPDAYSKPAYQRPIIVPVQYAKQQRRKYEIKEEIPELGEKWRSLSSIEKVDLTKLEKVKTGFTELDKRIGGMYMSEVTILSGSNASGKSSWLNSLILNIVQQGYKVALWSGELRDDILKTWIQMVAAGAHNLKKSKYDEGRYYVPESVSERIDQWLDGKFFLYNNSYGTKAEQILNDMETLADAGVKVFMLDNLMSMDINLFDGDKNNQQKEVVLRIKDFAMSRMSNITLVAHPRKTMAFLRKNDISGSGDILNIVDNCWIMHRTNEDFIHAITEFYSAAKASELRRFGNILAVEKNRLYGVVDYMCGLHYDVASRRFLNAQDEVIRYGWEQEPTQIGMQSVVYDDYEDSTNSSMPFAAPTDETPPF